MAEDSWSEVRSKFDSLGLKLKLHLDEGESADEADDPDATDEEDRNAIEDLGNRIQETLSGMGNAAKDPAIREDLKELGVLMRDAISNSVSSTGDKMGEMTAEARTKAEAAIADIKARTEDSDDADASGDADASDDADASEDADNGSKEASSATDASDDSSADAEASDDQNDEEE